MASSNTPGTTGAAGTTDVARQSGREVGRDAGQQAQEVAGTAREEAGRVAGEAKGQVTDLAADARQQLQRQARQQTDHLGETVEQFGKRVHALADGRPEEAGPVADYLHRVAGQAENLSDRIGEMGFDGMIDETQRFARRRPGMFLLGAATAGFAMSRLARGVRDAQQDGMSGASRQSDDGRQSTFRDGSDTARADSGGAPSAADSGQGLPQPSPAAGSPPPPPRAANVDPRSPGGRP